jgi:hypothetical protein
VACHFPEDSHGDIPGATDTISGLDTVPVARRADATPSATPASSVAAPVSGGALDGDTVGDA